MRQSESRTGSGRAQNSSTVRFRGIETSTFFGRPTGPCAEGAKRRANQFSDNDFRRAELRDVGFVEGIDLSGQLLPTGPDYIFLRDWSSRVAKARQVFSGWSKSERREAELVLRVYTTGGMEHQRDLFTRRDDVPGIPPELRDRIWDVLATD